MLHALLEAVAEEWDRGAAVDTDHHELLWTQGLTTEQAEFRED